MTTAPDLEASLRRLFIDHEYMADDEVVPRLAAEAQRMVHVRRRRHIVVGLAAGVAVIAAALGVFSALGLPGDERTEAPAVPAALPIGPLGDALRTFEASWSAAAPPKLTFVGPLRPDLRGGTTIEDKMVLNGRLTTADTALPESWPTEAVVRWSEGRTAMVPVLSPTQALDEIPRSYPIICKTCAPRVVTGARLTTMLLSTTTGEAQVPAWEFSLEGTTAAVLMPAIPETHVVKPVPEALSASFPAAEEARVSGNGRELTLTFTGESPDCNVTYTAIHARSEHAVAVQIEESSKERCNFFDVGFQRQLTIHLDKPIGDDAVLDGRHGNPIRVER